MSKMGNRAIRVGLVGNPNCGKSTVFNQLTGLRQRTGNFPGVTVEVKEGILRLTKDREVILTDFPGAYSLYPTSSDERVLVDVLCNPKDPHFPSVLVYIADVTHLEKHLLLFSQLVDLQLPLILALNMVDLAEEEGMTIQTAILTEHCGVPVVGISGRTGLNIEQLRALIDAQLQHPQLPQGFYRLTEAEQQIADTVRQNLPVQNDYRALLSAHHHSWLSFLAPHEKQTLAAIVQTKNFQSLRAQIDETLERYDRFTPVVESAVKHPPTFPVTTTDRIDNFLTHRWWGPLTFFGVMTLVFMLIFYGYEITGGWVESAMDTLIQGAGRIAAQIGIPELGVNFLTKGLLEGFKGVLVFVPQVALLFFLVSLLEEVGYLARVVFMFDKTMRRYGMNGRSIVALIGGGACAVPAIKGARTISNWKERIITILVTPFISCSARIPVYMVLIPVALPNEGWWTWALVFGGMYGLGVVAALGSGWILKRILKTRDPSFLALEMPVYRIPHWKNVWLTVWEKVLGFVSGVWKPILLITIVLWWLSGFGPGDMERQALDKLKTEHGAEAVNNPAYADHLAAYRLEYSWAGRVGAAIEPAIRPLGYDWKIGVAILSSFMAREVFNSTMYIIYSLESVGQKEEEEAADQRPFERYVSLRQRMQEDTFRDNGRPVFTTATGFSLLVFYALAMQCMSTIAVVKQETKSWWWAILQFVAMSLLAYLAAWITWHIVTWITVV